MSVMHFIERLMRARAPVDRETSSNASQALDAWVNARDSGEFMTRESVSVIRNSCYGDSDDGVLSKQDAWLRSP